MALRLSPARQELCLYRNSKEWCLPPPPALHSSYSNALINVACLEGVFCSYLPFVKFRLMGRTFFVAKWIVDAVAMEDDEDYPDIEKDWNSVLKGRFGDGACVVRCTWDHSFGGGRGMGWTGMCKASAPKVCLATMPKDYKVRVEEVPDGPDELQHGRRLLSRVLLCDDEGKSAAVAAVKKFKGTHMTPKHIHRQRNGEPSVSMSV